MAEAVLFNIAEEIIKKLGSLAAQEVALWWGVKNQLRKLMETVTRIKAVLDDATEQAEKQNHQVRDWLGKLQEAVYDAEDLLDDFSIEVQRKQLMHGKKVWRKVCIFFSRSNQFVYGLRMGHKVKSLRKRLDEIVADSENFHLEVRDEENTSLTMFREQTTSSEPEVIVGREGDKLAVKTFLLNSNHEQNVSVISIVGIGGLGKTTLAQNVFNDEQVNVHFCGQKLWVSVSGGLDVRKILKQAVGKNSDELENLKNDLQNKVEKKKYLLVLDDVWDGKDGGDGEKWDSLKKILPRDAIGSKIIVTTRSHVIAKFTSTITPYVLEGLSLDKSWDLFRRMAFPQGQESEYYKVDEKIRKEIVERCCGVPLVIKSIARLMCLKDRAQWLSFIVNELPDRIRDDNIIQTLKLSYDPLPSYMKHCFAYCSLLPKGHHQKIDVKSLVQLWIAQGFVSSSNSGGRNLELAGLRCFENLAWRSFFHDVEKDDLGDMKTCKMHAFMHDLAMKVSGFESINIVDSGGKRISDLTRHVSLDVELDLSQQIPILLPCAKRLRTLMLLGAKYLGIKRRLLDRFWDEGESSEWMGGVWESICQDFRHLRVLDLHLFRIKEVSPFIEKLKHLKYLDLSYNMMEALPNSITNLVNLQVLKLNGCWRLKELPRDINKLINLMHLDLGCSADDDLCVSLEYMPCGIGQLTCLQTLSYFVVAKSKSQEPKMVGGLDELSRLNELRGRLKIRVKGYERKSCVSEFEGAKFIEKQYLQLLAIECDSLDQDDNDSDIDLHDKMLQGLEPHSNLQNLWVEGCGGMRFPSWLSHLTNLVRILLKDCRYCKHIPPFHEISSLEELFITDMDNLEYIDSEGVGGRGVSTFFPSLKELYIRGCPSLMGWWKKSSSEDQEINYDSDDELSTATSTTTDQQQELSFPCLSSLKISLCPNLTSMPLFPSLDDKLWLERSSSVPLQQTMKMKGWKSPSPPSSVSSSSFIHPLSKLKELSIDGLEDLESLPEDGLQNLSSLQQLLIIDCQRLKSLPLPDQGMHSLQSLWIWGCGELRSVSENPSQGIPYLPSLQELEIKECSEELSGRIREGKEAVEYWPFIKHIPSILIDYHYIQKDGRYVKDM